MSEVATTVGQDLARRAERLMRVVVQAKASSGAVTAPGSPQGAVNFRGVGGVPGLGGAVVRPGVVFRSGSLDGLTPLGWEQLTSLGVRTVIDLRSPAESTAAPTRPTEHQEVVNLPMWQEPTGAAAFTEEVFEQLPPGTSAAEALRIYSDAKVAGYKAMIRTFPRVFGGAVSILAHLAGQPALVHCTAGKDRTGLVCAVVLAAVGVGEAEIVEDYLCSRDGISPEAIERYRGSLQRLGIPLAEFLPLCGAYLPALIGAFDEIALVGGSVEGYLCGAGGVSLAELEQLRSALLDPGTAEQGNVPSPVRHGTTTSFRPRGAAHER